MLLRLLAAASTVVFGLAAPACAQDFPFGRELVLDARPMKGGKRIPSMEIDAGGRGTMDLWCNSMEVEAVIAGQTVTLLLGPAREERCTPERARADAELVEALTGVTQWRREGEALVLSGGRTLRFRPQTN